MCSVSRYRPVLGFASLAWALSWPVVSAAPPAAAPAPASLRKLRRSASASFLPCFIRFASFSDPLCGRCPAIPNSRSRRRASDHGECLLLDLEERPAHRSERRIEDGRLGRLHVAE